MTAARSTRRLTPVRAVGLAAGLVAFLALTFLDSPLKHFGDAGDRPARAAAASALMAVWWITEALPIYVTAAVPLVLFPWFGVFPGGVGASVTATAASYTDWYIMLFAGGMCIAAAMQQWGLDRRVALTIMRAVGTEPKRLLLGFLCATAFISLWISNTATAAMMMPIGMAVIAQLERRGGGTRLADYGCAVMMSIAYASNIGGIGTKIGTPTNAQLGGMLEKSGHPVSFLQFAALGMPFVLLLLPAAWWVLWRVGRSDAPAGSRADDAIAAELRTLGPASRGEKIVMLVFVATAGLWIGGKPLADAAGLALEGRQIEGGVAIAAALALLAMRNGGRAVLEVRTLRRVPWETLLLLGGSFAMGEAIKQSGLSDWLALRLAVLRGQPAFVQVLLASLVTVAITAVASNTATVAVLLPLLRNADPPARMLTVLFASTFAASCDFALPAGTPPNAIVFGSGYVTIPRMVRTGVALDLVAALLAALWCYLAVPLIL